MQADAAAADGVIRAHAERMTPFQLQRTPNVCPHPLHTIRSQAAAACQQPFEPSIITFAIM